MKTQLLLVEDDSGLGETLRERLLKEGYEVERADTLGAARSLIDQRHFDLFVLDVGLPDGSGFELAKWIRTVSGSPFLFLTAQSGAEMRLEGYEIGAEEFIPKPFHLKELLMRVRHVLENHAPPSTLEVGELTLNFASHRVEFSDGRTELLTQKETELLRLLTQQAPRVVSRDEILNRVWGEDKFPSNRTVDNTIVRLRQVLGPELNQMIRSVRGVGYQWDANYVQ